MASRYNRRNGPRGFLGRRISASRGVPMILRSEANERVIWKAALAPGSDCIPIERLAETLSAAESRHLSTCPRCQTELSLWHEFSESTPRPKETAAVAWIARKLQHPPAARPAREARWWQNWLPVPVYRLSGAFAAMLLVSGGVALYRSRVHSEFAPVTEPGAFRSQSVVVSSPVGEVDTPPVEFRWQGVPAALVYEVELLEVDRHSLWKSETGETSLAVPASIRAAMSPGKTLLWQVTARNASRATLANSGMQKFRVKIKKNIRGEL